METSNHCPDCGAMTGIERIRAMAQAVFNASNVDGDMVFLEGMPLNAWLDRVADQIERETLLRPLFEDGTPVQVGDVVLFDGKPFAVHACEVKLACLEQHAVADVLHRAKKLAGVE